MRRTLLALALAAGVALPAAPAAEAGTGVIPTIRQAAARYSVSGSLLVRVARCESSFNTRAVGSAGEIGLFQFKPATWQTTPYRRFSIWSPWAQANAAAWSFAHGRSGQWTCA
jgi:soluble lytic murein transglycosylase-like protein